MQITVPTNIGSQPLFIIIGGVRYALGAGETLDVPDAVAAELARMIASKGHAAEPVDLPFADSAVKQTLQALGVKLSEVEALAQAKELPDYPEEAGTYTLQCVMADGEATLSWEAIEAAAGE